MSRNSIVAVLALLAFIMAAPVGVHAQKLDKNWKEYIIDIYPHIKFISEPDDYISGTPPGMPNELVQKLKEKDDDYNGGYYYRIVVRQGHRNDYLYVELIHYTGNEDFDKDIFSYVKINPTDLLPQYERDLMMWIREIEWLSLTRVKIVSSRGEHEIDMSSLKFYYER